MEYQNLTLLQFAELLEKATSPDVPTWVREFYWAAVEADKGDKEAIRTLLAGFATDANDALKWREFKEDLEHGEFSPVSKYRRYREAIEDVNTMLDNYVAGKG